MATTHASSGSMVYARALAEAVQAEGGSGLLRDVEGVLRGIAAAWGADRTFRGYFLSSEVPRAQRRTAMKKLVDGRMPPLLGNFLRLLLDRGRLALLPEIDLALRTLADEALGRVPVTITTAVPVPERDFRAWTEALKAATGADAVVEHIVKPDIIAGAIIRVGDRIADGSARRQLADLRKRIIERGSRHHALQS
jgi:F-type H+-transporting ATPase subunit delta